MPRTGSMALRIQRLWSCFRDLVFRRPTNFEAIELLACSHDDWKKSSASESYRVSGLLRDYQRPILFLIEQEQRVLFLSDPGIASSILATQLRSALSGAGHLVKSLS